MTNKPLLRDSVGELSIEDCQLVIEIEIEKEVGSLDLAKLEWKLSKADTIAFGRAFAKSLQKNRDDSVKEMEKKKALPVVLCRVCDQDIKPGDYIPTAQGACCTSCHDTLAGAG